MWGVYCSVEIEAEPAWLNWLFIHGNLFLSYPGRRSCVPNGTYSDISLVFSIFSKGDQNEFSKAEPQAACTPFFAVLVDQD